VPALLNGLRAECDRFLEHALIYALIEIADREATLTGLRDVNLRLRRAALIALDQMDGGNLTREQVVPLLDTEDPKLWQTAWGVVTARPEWAGAVAGLVGQWLARGDLPSSRREALRTALLAFCKDSTVQELVAQALRTESTPTATRLLLLEVMSQAPLDKLPAAWISELGRGLDQRDGHLVRQTVATIRTRNLTDFDAGLQRVAADTRHDADVRSAALAAVAPRLKSLTPEVVAFALARLDPNLPPLSRLTAAEALGHARLDDGQLEAVLKVMPGASPLELPHLVAAFEHGKNAKVGQGLIAALEKSPALTSLASDALRQTLQGYPPEVRQAAEPLLKRLAVDAEKQKARLAELEPALTGGDAKRGRAVFFGRKATCSTCHTVKTEGGHVGPDLTKIGSIRTARDLLEAVVFPSASIVRGYEPYVVATRDGRLLTGIFGRETADAITLVNAERAEIRVPRTAIESIAPSRVSIMPQGMDAQLSKQELADLVAYLQSLR
jgi:putative heme-binding domain-containing protein